MKSLSTTVSGNGGSELHVTFPPHRPDDLRPRAHRAGGRPPVRQGSTNQDAGANDGNQTSRNAAVRQRPRRLVHRHGPHRPALSGPRPGARRGRRVTFEPGARTAWHTHPLGQTLIVTAGCGRAQRWGGPIEEIRPGDVVWFPPGEKHWHGAAPTTAMTHIAIQEQLDGKAVDWMEHVSDEQYGA